MTEMFTPGGDGKPVLAIAHDADDEACGIVISMPAR